MLVFAIENVVDLGVGVRILVWQMCYQDWIVFELSWDLSQGWLCAFNGEAERLRLSN